jgi:hypothetical protein
MADSSIRAVLIEDGPNAGKWKAAGWVKVGGVLEPLINAQAHSTQIGALRAGREWVKSKLSGKDRR